MRAKRKTAAVTRTSLSDTMMSVQRKTDEQRLLLKASTGRSGHINHADTTGALRVTPTRPAPQGPPPPGEKNRKTAG